MRATNLYLSPAGLTARVIPMHADGSSEAYSLVDAGFGYALAPTLYTMPDPFHRILRWRGSPTALYVLYHRTGARDGLVPQFASIATERYGAPGYARPLPESWRP